MNGTRTPGLSRRTVGLVVVLFAAVVGSVAWSLIQRAPSAPPVPIERKLMAQRPRPVEPEILRVPPREMRALVRQDALLKPDRRFVLAFEDVAALEGARPEGGAKVSSRDRRWTIDAGGGIRAELSDIPGFFETLEALRGAARARIPAGGRKVAASETRRLRGLASNPFEGRAIGALREIDALWASGFDRSELLDLAARALVTIKFAAHDALEVGDAVGGRAFAVLALAEAASGTRFPEREVLLADTLGYGGEARTLARELPVGEPVRLFLEGPDEKLKALAEGAAASPVVRYLYALRFAAKANVADVFDWLKSHGAPRASDPAVIAAALRAKDVFDHALRLNSTLMMAGWTEAGGKEEQPGPGLLASFERTLAARGREKGRFFDDAVAVAQTRAVFYSGLFGVGSFYLDSLSSGPAAQQFIDYLKGAEPGPGADFQRWYRNLAAEKNGEIRAEKLVDDLTSLPALGQAALRRTGQRVNKALYSTSPARPSAAAALERVLDSRAANDYLFSVFCHYTLMHPIAFERYYRASRERVGRYSDDPWLAHQLNDAARLRAIASDPEADEEAQLQAIKYLDAMDAIEPEATRIAILGILSRHPGAGTTMGCMRVLWENGSLDDAEAFLRRWLETNTGEHVLTRALYASRLEHVLFLGGRFEEAWRAIEPFVSTGKADALEAGAEALDGIGRHADALQMSADAVNRYPDSGWGRSGRAMLLWRQGLFDEAPKVLLDARHPLNPYDWSDAVARDFFDVFGRKGPAEARKAFDALIRAGVNPWFLFSFAEPFAKHKQYDTAIDLLGAVARAKNERIDGYLNEYRFRILRDGRKGANRWFRSEVAGSASASWVGETAFDQRKFELLWLLPDSDAVWMLRAEAAAFEGGPDEAEKQKLVEHFRNPKTPANDALDGLFLLGLETEDRLFESVTDARRRCDAAFLLGLKAVGEKRLEDACDWLRVCQKAGLAAWPRYKRAEALLRPWDVRRFGIRGVRDIP
jgi:hypothetical protein